MFQNKANIWTLLTASRKPVVFIVQFKYISQPVTQRNPKQKYFHTQKTLLKTYSNDVLLK